MKFSHVCLRSLWFSSSLEREGTEEKCDLRLTCCASVTSRVGVKEEQDWMSSKSFRLPLNAVLLCQFKVLLKTNRSVPTLVARQRPEKDKK